MNERIYVHPGEVQVRHEAALFVTILGSCVAVCLWNSRSRAAGINHFLLPYRTRPASGDRRFAGDAMAELVRRLLELGSRPADLRAKVFGGASMLSANAGEALGAQNVHAAMDELEELGIPLDAYDVGGRCARKIAFDTATFAISVELLGGDGQ